MLRRESSSCGLTSCTTRRSCRRCEATRPTEVYNLAAPSFVPQSWDEPIRTAEFAAVGATSMLEAIREVDPTIRFYQASSSEIFGDPSETPQTEEHAPEPADALRSRENLRALHRAELPQAVRHVHACGILYNHESPLRPVNFLPRKVARAAAAISLGLESELVLGELSARRDWGYAGDYVRAMWLMLQHDEPGDYIVATGRFAFGRGARRVRLRRGLPRLARARAHPTPRCTAARPSSTTSSGTRRRHTNSSAGYPRSGSTSLSGSLWTRTLLAFSAIWRRARRPGHGRAPSRPT